MEKREKHFVLVHGACHGAWCWYKVATLLKSAGHKVTALDMAASGIHPKQVQDIHSLSDYYQPLLEFLAALPPEERVILVGHSMGGIGISIAMEKFPEKVSVAVFASAFNPGPELKLSTMVEEHRRRVDSYMDSQYEYGNGLDKPPTSLLFGRNLLSSKFYQLSPPEDLMLAMLLTRPNPTFEDTAMLDATAAVTKERYGSVCRVYVVCDRDYAIGEDLQRWMIDNNPTDDVILIPGSDHMVMFSKTQELVSCLQEIAEKFS